MTVDIISENLATFTTPRISFSNDFQNDETQPTRLDHILVDSTFDFAFNVDSTTSFHSSTADELFFNGKILPTSIKKIPCLDHVTSMEQTEEKKKSLKEFLEDTIENKEKQPNMVTPRSFWKFRRSSSVNSDKNMNKRFIGSSKILPRSGSTGKFMEKIVEDVDIENNTSYKKLPFWKMGKTTTTTYPVSPTKNGLSGSKLNPFRRSSSLNCDTKRGVNLLSRSFSTGFDPNKEQQFVTIDAKSCKKSQVKSYGYGNYNNNKRVSNVLNIPCPYISRASVDLFGFGSLFCNGNNKDRKKRK